VWIRITFDRCMNFRGRCLLEQCIVCLAMQLWDRLFSPKGSALNLCWVCGL